VRHTHVLFLGRPDSQVLAHLSEVEDRVVRISHRFLWADARVYRADFLVSHLYLHLVPARVLARFPGRAVNLHNSFLPYNRGWHAPLFSAIDGTPNGVTIHYMDERFDTGPIIAQHEVPFRPDDTLRIAWWRLQSELTELFVEQWPAIRAERCEARPQPPGGSYHRRTDRDAVEHLLTRGNDTPVSELARAGRDQDSLSRE
jgi:methionyl-tRNA formyltransferase